MNDERRLLAGRYEVGDLIGRGGMADVHLGFDTRLGREVAIKILRSELARDRSFLMRFRREAQSAASLNHPAIVAVFDSGEESVSEHGSAPVSVPFIVMEYVRGRTLRDVLTDDGPLEPFEAARIMSEVLRALDYSHDNGIIHRDIKPANVMMGLGGQPKVMDFGIARAIADTAATMTNTSVVVGTAQYLSPEQAQGQEVDSRSDLYSAGCLLYELVAGRPPFIGDSPVAIAYQHVGEPPQPPSVHAAGIPASLDVVVLHSLAKEPESRYQSGEAFAADLDAVVTGGPTLAAREAVSNGRMSPAREVEDIDRTGSTMAVPPPVEVVTEEPEERKRSIWPIVAGVLTLLALLLGVLWQQGLFDRSPSPVAVPAVVQQTQEQATKALIEAGFQVATQPVQNKARAGTVVAQKPEAQSMQPPGSTVTLSVSSGPGKVTVPDLSNYEQALASQRLDELGLQIGEITPVDSMTVDQGKVVSTDPKAGMSVAKGTSVKLKVSTGRVAVPNLVGLSERKAVEALGKVGLRADPAQVDSDAKEGTVVAQAFPEGTKVPVGDVIQISVARARPAPTTVTTKVTVTETAPVPGDGGGSNSGDSQSPSDPEAPPSDDDSPSSDSPDPAQTPTG